MTWFCIRFALSECEASWAKRLAKEIESCSAAAATQHQSTDYTPNYAINVTGHPRCHSTHPRSIVIVMLYAVVVSAAVIQ